MLNALADKGSGKYIIEAWGYGHANAESLAGLLIGAMISITGIFIIVEGVDGWLVDGDLPEPGTLGLLGGALLAIVAIRRRKSPAR